MAGFDLYRGLSDDQEAKSAYLMYLFNMVRVGRVNFEVQWEESAALYLPEYRNSWAFGHNRPPGVKYTQQQVDSTGSIAAHRFMAIADALVTPHNMLWSQVGPAYNKGGIHKELLKDRDTRQYFADVTQCLWYHRYRSEANFISQQLTNWLCLGVFGSQSMFVDEYDGKPGKFSPGLRYITQGPGEVYLLTNFQNRVTGCIRQFRWTARQAYSKWGDELPPTLMAAAVQNSVQRYDFLHFVIPRTDYVPEEMLTDRSKPYWSVYFSVEGYHILEEGGYYTFPLAHGRYTQAPEEDYGRGPGQQVLPEAKTLNAEKGVFLKQGHRAGDPSYLLADDGLTDFKSHPGSYNYGGMSPDGKPLVGILPTGDIQVTQEMMAESKQTINDAFLVSLFPLLFDQKGGQKSAREVVEMANQVGIFAGPALGRQFGEYCGSLIPRELDTLSRLGLLPKMPDILREARGEYQISYTSPLAKAMRGQAVAGFMRSVEMAREIVQSGGPEEVMDVFDFDTALPEMADDQFVPPSWMADAAGLAAKRKNRADAAKREEQVKSLPGLAAMAKAQAIVAKAQTGGNTGGTLSGTPQGGMPQVPGNAPGQPGQPGIGGAPGLSGQPAPGP